MNDEKDMTSQPGPGTTRRDERISPASRFTTSLLLQRSSGAKAILSNLKDLITMRVPKFAHSSGSTPTITLKDENFGRSQFASFAFHGSLALLLFMTFVTHPPFGPKIPNSDGGIIFSPPPDFLQKILPPKDAGGNSGGGGGGERSPDPRHRRTNSARQRSANCGSLSSHVSEFRDCCWNPQLKAPRI